MFQTTAQWFWNPSKEYDGDYIVKAEQLSSGLNRLLWN